MRAGTLALGLLAPALVAALVVLALGNPAIAWLRRKGAGQRVRDDGPQRHLQKAGTPTMGGMLIIGALALAALATGAIATARVLPLLPPGDFRRVLLLVAVTLAAAGIGLADDWRKVTRGRSLGLKARHKLLLQFLVAGAFVLAVAGERWQAQPPPRWADAAGWALFWTIAIIAASNAVNLADGLDGLAGGLCVISGVGFALISLKANHPALAVVAVSLAGACLGFLWFNRHPARMFMGDVGSLALGAGLGAIAARLDAPLALAGLLLVPFVEMLSVIIQVISFRTTGRRVFRMSPLHHHFELCGWPERRVVYTFWAVQAVAAAGVVAWYTHGWAG